MSPAKRKSAKSGRATSVAARAGKARGKARGSALTKAVKVKGKTPAKRGDHRLAARGGAKNGARNGKGVACDLPREQLELLLDREEGRADVLTHVPACHPCTTSLTVIASQRDAIRHLTAEPSGTAVEYLLERGARAGERKLADLVYELAKACVVVGDEIARRVKLVDQPRDGRVVAAEINGVGARLPMRAAPATGAPQVGATTESARLAWGACLALLDQLEGETGRTSILKSVYLITSGRAPEAEAMLSRQLAIGVSKEFRPVVFCNLLWALDQQKKYRETLRLLPSEDEHGLRGSSAEWMGVYNFAVAAACERNWDVFSEQARRLSRIAVGSRAEREHRTSLLRHEAAQFAEKLNVDVGSIARVFGLGSRGVAASDVAN